MPNRTLLAHFAMLRTQLVALEADLGLDGIGEDEINIICALANSSPTATDACAVNDLRVHPLCRRMSKPTFYRAMASLMSTGWVSRTGSVRSGIYALNLGSAHRA